MGRLELMDYSRGCCLLVENGRRKVLGGKALRCHFFVHRVLEEEAADFRWWACEENVAS